MGAVPQKKYRFFALNHVITSVNSAVASPVNNQKRTICPFSDLPMRCSPAMLSVLLLMKILENDRYGSFMTKQSLEHITILYTFNGATIFFGAIPTTILHNHMEIRSKV